MGARHYAKDGIVLRYRMYAGITSPYLNRGGLQSKFEKKGESITAEERSTARKVEERWGADELRKMFPRLIGPPRPRRDKKTMEVVFHFHGCPPGEHASRRMRVPSYRDGDWIRYGRNPKCVGSVSWGLYEKYKVAKTVKEAKKLGSRAIDFAFDSNWGYLHVVKIQTAPVSEGCVMLDKDCGVPRKRLKVALGKSETPHIKIRYKEMSEGHQGMNICRKAITRLAEKCPALCRLPESEWVALGAPLAKAPLDIVRILLHWAEVGTLQFRRQETAAVHAALKLCGSKEAASCVKLVERPREERVAEKAREAVAARRTLKWMAAKLTRRPKKQPPKKVVKKVLKRLNKATTRRGNSGSKFRPAMVMKRQATLKNIAKQRSTKSK